MSMAIDDLMNEHEAVIFALNVLDKINHRLKSNPGNYADDISSILSFFREFADKCHHGKEEGILFPAMESHGIARVNGPIGEMLEEHELGRILVREMGSAVHDNTVETDTFIGAAEKYITLLIGHIERENTMHFPLAESRIPEHKLEKIYDDFEEHEEKVIGSGRHEELHDILNSLEEKYMK